MARKCWDDLRNHSLNDISREYYEEIRSLAEEIVKDANEREGGDLHDTLSRVMHEWVGWHEWVIHSHQAKFVCLVSRHEDEHLEHHQTSDRGDVEFQAYHAMYQDILDNIRVHISDYKHTVTDEDDD